MLHDLYSVGTCTMPVVRNLIKEDVIVLNLRPMLCFIIYLFICLFVYLFATHKMKEEERNTLN